MPPAFVLSQDQTLQSNYNIFAYEDLFPSDDFDSSIKFIVFLLRLRRSYNLQNLTRAHRTIQFFKELAGFLHAK